jgi:radical SAM protein with 4Fe4S-binding SPASM domain
VAKNHGCVEPDRGRAPGVAVDAGTPADPLAPELPRELQVEITGACNLRCRMCLVRYRPPIDRISGSFGFDDFTRLVDSNPRLERLTLQGLGEPLLVPHLVDMVEYAASRGVSVGFNTNGTLLTRAKAERLILAGLAWLHVSLDGASAVTYEGIRDGARFERVVANIAGLAEAKAALGTARPDLQIVFVAMRDNVGELPELVRLAARVGVPDVWVQNLSHSFSDTDPAGSYAEIRSFAAVQALGGDGRAELPAAAVFAEARRVAGELGITLRLPRLTAAPADDRPLGQPGCDWPWTSSYVTHDGKVQPCCMVMGSDRVELANLQTESFAAAWHGAAYREFRAALLTGDPPAVCRGCSSYLRTF